ncbi:LmbU family transcriptional regulator [Spirillospora sp. NPDC047279]|uniref:LmbU family transcriptional regulator n=1 Tax=Spirillospora sp. NPDC047279 TaxID=3155478 RepID=UPI0033D7DB27
MTEETMVAAGGGKRLSLDGRALTRRVGLALPAELPLGSWVDIGRQIGVIADASAWWLGDWLVYGQRCYPDRYQRAIDQTGLSYQTLRNYAWIARRFAVSRRRDTLSMQHHAVVAALGDEEQDVWLERAEREGWSVSRLKNRLRSDRSRPAPTGEAVVVVTMEIDPHRRKQWEEAAQRAGADLAYWASQILDQAALHILQTQPTLD